MPDRLSIMLDSMMSAVDNGLSYDGIVSVPEIGLEDYGRRPGLVGRFDDGVELFRRTHAAVSRAMKRLFHGSAGPPPERDPRRRPTQQPHPSPPHDRASGELSMADSGLGPGGDGDTEKLPRRRDTQRLDPSQGSTNSGSQGSGQGSVLEKESPQQYEGAQAQHPHDGTRDDTEKLPRKREEQDPMSISSLRKEDEQTPEGSNAGQLSQAVVTGPGSGAIPASTEKLPRSDTQQLHDSPRPRDTTDSQAATLQVQGSFTGGSSKKDSGLQVLHDVTSGDAERLPTEIEEQDPIVGMKPPRKKDEPPLSLGGVTHPTAIGQSLPTAENEGAIPVSTSQLSLEQGRLPRRREEGRSSENDQDGDEGHSVGDVTHQTAVGQSLPSAENEGVILGSTSQLIEQGRLPRRREVRRSFENDQDDEGRSE